MKNKKLYLFLTFILSAVILLIVFAFMGILGKNNNSIFIGDMFAQYIPFIKSFLSVLRGEDSLWYSFSNYMGSGNILKFCYYSLNPFNIIFFFENSSNIQTLIIILIVLKIGLASSSFQYFLSKYITNDFFGVIISVFYGLSAFTVFWYYNVMWLDVAYIMPFLIASIISFIEDKKYLALIFSYIYLFLTNFYIGYIAGIFSALVYVLYVFYKLELNSDSIKKYLLMSLKYAASVLLSIGVCAFFLLSTLGFLSTHMAADNDAFEELIVTFPDFVNSFFLGQMQSGFNTLPSLYCGIPVFLLAILFFINKNINKKMKILFGILLGIYILSMMWIPLYSFMHAFDYPNAYAFRFSFAVIFIVCLMAAISYKYIDANSSRIVIYLALLLAIFYSFMINYQMITYEGGNKNTQSGLVYNLVFLLIWSLFLFFKKKLELNINSYIISVCVVFIAVIELSVNSVICLKQEEFVNLKDTEINQWYYGEKNAIESIKATDPEDFYRIYVNNEWCSNAPSIFGYNGVVSFSSADNFYLRNTLSKYGFPTSNRFVNAHGVVEPMKSLLGVRYSVNLPDDIDYTKEMIQPESYHKAEILKNDNALSLGYMVSSDVRDIVFEDNSFKNIENLCNTMTGKNEKIFDDIELKDIDMKVNNFNVYNEDGKYSFEIVSDVITDSSVIFESSMDDELYIEFFEKNPTNSAKSPWVVGADAGLLNDSFVVQGGIYRFKKMGENCRQVALGFGNYDFSVDRINLATYNSDAYSNIYEELSKNQFFIDINNEDFISGKVLATEEKPFLFTTIPYDSEWIAYVDGQVVYPEAVLGGGFLGLELTPGEHTVSFEYIEIYSFYGAIISFISLMILGILLSKWGIGIYRDYCKRGKIDEVK